MNGTEHMTTVDWLQPALGRSSLEVREGAKPMVPSLPAYDQM